jgi:hypothetical protein
MLISPGAFISGFVLTDLFFTGQNGERVLLSEISNIFKFKFLSILSIYLYYLFHKFTYKKCLRGRTGKDTGTLDWFQRTCPCLLS